MRRTNSEKKRRYTQLTLNSKQSHAHISLATTNKNQPFLASTNHNAARDKEEAWLAYELTNDTLGMGKREEPIRQVNVKRVWVWQDDLGRMINDSKINNTKKKGIW